LARDRQLNEARRSPRPQAPQRAADAPAARKPATNTTEQRKPAGPERARPGAAQAAAAAPLGAAAQILVEAEQAVSAGKLAEAGRHLQLLTAMTFEDATIRARVAHLKTVVFRAQAVDFEKQAAYEEKQQRWGLAARSWLRVAEGRPKDSMPLQRAALAQLQAGVDLRQVMETAKRAVELAENDPQAHRILARVYVAAGMQANARRELEAAERCNPAPTVATAPAKQAGLFQRLLGRDPN
jgi:roadblock/LC7 domain-containing protein